MTFQGREGKGLLAKNTIFNLLGQILPMLDYVDMDGAVLLARDAASGVHLERGRAVYPDENGNGVRLL